tara:strand:+ start:393 stop:821 length:429 start_codon:yes stop_codon:yes gene_type:complete
MRVKLELPKKFHFETTLSIRVSDLNYGAHLGNDSVLSLAHESRVRFFLKLGVTERNFFNVGLIMADSVVMYKSQGFLNDNILIRISVTEFRSHGFKIFYLLQKKDFNVDLAYVQTSMVCFDYLKNKILPLPNSFKDVVNEII